MLFYQWDFAVFFHIAAMPEYSARYIKNKQIKMKTIYLQPNTNNYHRCNIQHIADIGKQNNVIA